MNNTMTLENVKETFGNEKLVNKFKNTLKTNKMRAIKLINDQNLSFSTLFILFPVIRQYKLLTYLSTRNKLAYNFCNQILEKQKSDYKEGDTKTFINVLEWIVKSADVADGIADDFDKIVDVSVAKLLNEFNDKEVLKPAVDLAFKRNKKKEFNHDLVWSLFKTNDVNILEHVAEYLKSEDKEDNNFSTELLSNAIESDITVTENNKYDNYVLWLKENNQYINFTGEGYNQSSQPNFFKVDKVLKDKDKAIYVMNENVQPQQLVSEPEKVNNNERKLSYSEMKLMHLKTVNQIEEETTAFWDKFMLKNTKLNSESSNKDLGGAL